MIIIITTNIIIITTNIIIITTNIIIIVIILIVFIKKFTGQMSTMRYDQVKSIQKNRGIQFSP